MDVYLGQPPATADPVKDSETGRIKEILHQILKVRWDKAKDIGARGAVLMRERADIQELLNLSEQLSGLQPGTLESLCGKQLAEQADMLPENERSAFRAGVQNALDGLRQSLNLGVVPEPPAFHKERPVQEVEIAADSSPIRAPQPAVVRHSVKVRLKKIKQNGRPKPVSKHLGPKFQRDQGR